MSNMVSVISSARADLSHPATVTTWDGSTISAAVSGVTAHSWTADQTGLFAEAVLENTNLAKLSTAKQQAFREDVQRELDAVWAAMQINLTSLGISPQPGCAGCGRAAA